MKLHATDIAGSASAASIVHQALRRAIVEGALEVGEPLRQDEIARMFNTSRIPVREAIAMLRQQGLVTARRYKGAVVAGLTVDEAAEIFDFRALIEGAVIEAATPRLTQAALAKARAQLEGFSAAPDAAARGRLNRAFHAALYEGAAMPCHLQAIDAAMDRVERYLHARHDDARRTSDEHAAILAACAGGLAKTAAELTRRHILGARADVLDRLAR